MKKAILLLNFLIASIFLNAQPTLQWAKSVGGSTNFDEIRSMAIDAFGNVYTTGRFSGTVDFDPGPGVVYLVSSGGSSMTDAFVLKQDALGNFIWAKRIGGTSYDSGWAITVDASGNVIMGGHFSGTSDFDPGTGVFNLTSAGDEDAFVLKLDPSGNFLWAKRYGTASANHTWTVVTDHLDNVYIAGWHDAFITKLDPSGTILWTKNFSSSWGDVKPLSLQVDPSGNVFVTGDFQGTADFDPGSAVFNLSCVSGDYYAFILKLDTSGNFLWAKSFGDGAGTVAPQSMTIDHFGNIYTTGLLMGTGDFDPGPGVFTLTPTDFSDDVFISKLDASGNFLWAKNIAGAGADLGRSITTDASGNVYAAGILQGTMAFNPGSSSDSIISTGRPVYIMKLNSAGNFIWVRTLDINQMNDVFSLLVDNYNNIYAAGSYSGICNIDFGTGIYNMTSSGGQDAYVLKLNQSFNGITENENNSISIYPNPTTDLFIIQIPILSGNNNIEIYNNLGALVYKRITLTELNTIDLSDRADGIYFVKVMSENKIVASQKIIKR